MLADGGDCVADLGVLRDQPQLFGAVASGPTAWRAVQLVDEHVLDGLRDARARVRARAWAAGARPERVVLDFDSHLITSHSEKEGAAPTWKRGFAFTRCCVIWMRPARHWPGCCGRATPARTPPPPITSGCSSIRCARDAGLKNLPFSAFEANACWLELVLCAQDLICFTQRLLLDGELASCEPKRLRYRLLHVAGRITRHARNTRLRLPRSWPWATALLAAFTRLRVLPAPG